MDTAFVSPKAAPEKPAEALSKKRRARMRTPLGLRPHGALMRALPWPTFAPPRGRFLLRR